MFKYLKYRFSFINSLFPYAIGLKRFFAIGFFSGIVILWLQFIPPVLYQVFIEDVILDNKLKFFIPIVVGYIAVFIFESLFSYLKLYCHLKLSNGILLRIRRKILTSLFVQNFENYDEQTVGENKQKLEDIPSKAANFVDSQIADYIIAVFKFVGTMLFLFYFDWRLALFSVFAIPLFFWCDDSLSKKEKIYNNEMRITQQKTYSWLHSGIQGWKEIKALNLHKYQKRGFLHLTIIYARQYASWIKYWTVRELLLPIIRDELLMKFGIYFLGGILIAFGKLKISELLVFSMYYGMLSESFKTVSKTDAVLQANMPYYDRILEDLNKGKIYASRIGGIVPNGYDIEVSNISFTYKGTKKKIFDNFSLSIKQGERIAIAGKSGCGKTTLLKLMTGILTPQTGSIYSSGINLNDIDLEAMHNKIGYVMQQNFLLNLSIRENLKYGCNTATDKEIIEACQKAYIYDFIKTLPKGLDTVIGERGVKLSGGQRQRIVLARMFLRNVDVYILDEATSALDQYSEHLVQDAINNISKEKTIIVVAHRESSLKVCEKIVYIGLGGTNAAG
jgi:ABC-type bacteriocin/lantibiotic exporter with double-glycine peptidase domain